MVATLPSRLSISDQGSSPTASSLPTPNMITSLQLSRAPKDKCPSPILTLASNVVGPPLMNLCNCFRESAIIQSTLKQAVGITFLKKPTAGPTPLATVVSFHLSSNLPKYWRNMLMSNLHNFLRNHWSSGPFLIWFPPHLQHGQPSDQIIEVGSSAALILLDLPAAFDRMYHSTLI